MSIAPCYAKFGLVLVVACCPEMLAAYAWLFRPACEALGRGGIRVSRRDYPVDVVRSVRRFEGVKLVALTHMVQLTLEGRGFKELYDKHRDTGRMQRKGPGR